MASTVKNQSLESCQVTKLAWKINNYSKLKVKKLFSQIFMVAGYKWRIFIYPTKENRVDDYLCLYIQIIDEPTAATGWFVDADITFYVIDQFDRKKSVDRDTKCTFKHGLLSWGYASFISHDKLHDQSRGYLVDDACLIEVDVSVSAAAPFSLNNAQPADSSVSVDPSIDNLLYLDPMDSIYTNAQSFLKSRPKGPFSSISEAILPGRSAQDKGSLEKGHFNELISLPLDDLADPKLETAMRESMSTLGNDLSSFTEEQIQQIKSLKDQFPRIIEDWRDSVQLLVDSQSFFSDFEDSVYQLEDAVKTEEGIKVKHDELRRKCKELEKELEAAKKEAKQLIEQRREASKKTHQLYVAAKDQNVKAIHKTLDISQAKDELDYLREEWDTYRSQFT